MSMFEDDSNEQQLFGDDTSQSQINYKQYNYQNSSFVESFAYRLDYRSEETDSKLKVQPETGILIEHSNTK